jgi:predicted TIM-barrel fold metal-dependent hydrolase
MWANDFPHNDATWPESQSLLAKHTAHLPTEMTDRILHGNVASLYGLSGG